MSDALRRGGFNLHRRVGLLLGAGFCVQSLAIASATALVFVIGSALDQTFFLPGRDVGLLEHPGVWTCIGLQVALPLSMRHSLRRLLSERTRLREMAGPSMTGSRLISLPLMRFLNLETPTSRAVATTFYLVGLTAFVWNTYQDQGPGTVVPFDFWDSSNYPFGFWLTRLYRLYLFVWLLPYVALVHTAILATTLRIIRDARIAGRLELVPFHADGVGGFGFVPPLVTTPIVVTVFMSSLATAAAFVVHQGLDVTPLMALLFVLIALAIAYVVPMAFLRKDIVALKDEAMVKIRGEQQRHYQEMMRSRAGDGESLRSSSEAVDHFENLCRRIESLSTYPHLKRLLGYTGVALLPSVISAAFKLYSDLSPVISPFLKQP